ncbi:MAG: EAL domain-containing protein [Pseudomonadota bacterium]|nr:EAL domain-containing protein [Pseudomonadota bacterium]
MPFPALDDYLQRLSAPAGAPGSIWLNADGQAEGSFFSCVLSSAFEPIRTLGGAGPAGFEGLARGVAAADAGLSLWRLLDHAASDDESVELDRLCRMLHAINFFRQAEAAGADLYLSVHDRLLSAVSSNHGYAFRRILAALGLPREQIVLQLPPVSTARRWLLNYVADNYRRNGFRLALNVGTVGEAADVLGQVRPAAIKIDARALHDGEEVESLLRLTQAGAARLIVKRVDSPASLAMLEQASANTGVPVSVQGGQVDAAHAALAGSTASAAR